MKDDNNLTRVNKVEKPTYSFYEWLLKEYPETPSINKYNCLDNIVISKGRKIL